MPEHSHIIVSTPRPYNIKHRRQLHHVKTVCALALYAIKMPAAPSEHLSDSCILKQYTELEQREPLHFTGMRLSQEASRWDKRLHWTPLTFCVIRLKKKKKKKKRTSQAVIPSFVPLPCSEGFCTDAIMIARISQTQPYVARQSSDFPSLC